MNRIQENAIKIIKKARIESTVVVEAAQNELPVLSSFAARGNVLSRERKATLDASDGPCLTQSSHSLGTAINREVSATS